MLDKSIAFQTISLVLKQDILPNLSSEMAREQVIAMLSLLKNLDANTVPNDEVYRRVNLLLFEELEVILGKVNNRTVTDIRSPFDTLLEKLISLARKSKNESERMTWESLNELFSEVIQIVYQNDSLQPFIPDIRKTMRKQLNIEIKLVY
ncbi:hypothetical protein [Bacillus sp. MRMR6]|uniref:hypothetical protein n=1 Tax=Bacillus sp. MRMR6 TaxID=1928617 RepID=UPI0009518EFF|nr:hypothetical protein [Bacillus sp. MRMR6]OLS36170.1 hypothetical protein BTR25_18150 [Bacillus sp. MRMR6]